MCVVKIRNKLLQLFLDEKVFMKCFIFILSILCGTLCAMEQKFPSADQIGQDEIAYARLLETRSIAYLNGKLGIKFSKFGMNDPMIARLVTTVVKRIFILQDPNVKKRFCTLLNNPKTQDYTLQEFQINVAIADEALRSVLADRRLQTYIAKGTYDQPWMVRPEFDQLLKKKRAELGLTKTYTEKPKPERVGGLFYIDSWIGQQNRPAPTDSIGLSSSDDSSDEDVSLPPQNPPTRRYCDGDFDRECRNFLMPL